MGANRESTRKCEKPTFAARHKVADRRRAWVLGEDQFFFVGGSWQIFYPLKKPNAAFGTSYFSVYPVRPAENPVKFGDRSTVEPAKGFGRGHRVPGSGMSYWFEHVL